MKAHEINHNHNPTKTMSLLIELSIYALYGLVSILGGVSIANVLWGAFGSACTIFLVKLLAASAGSVSGAKLSRTIVTTSFWVKVGIGVSISLACSPSLFRYLSPNNDWLDIHAVYFVLGSFGVVTFRIITKFFGGVEQKADDLGEAIGDNVIKKVKPRKNDAD